MFYIINNTTETLALFDDNKDTLIKTLEFTPELKNERVLETDITTEDELKQYPYKVLVDDIEITEIVPDYEEQEVEVEYSVYEFTEEEQEYESVILDENGEPVLDEHGNIQTETKIRIVQIPVMEEYTDQETGETVLRPKFHMETKTELQQVKVGEHEETITVKGLVLNPNFETQKAAEERLKLDALTLTPADVERALYYGVNMDFDDLKTLIAQQAPQIDLKGLSIEFRANNFYRGAVDKNGNRIIDMVGAILGYTPADMDYLFQHKQLPSKNS